MNSTYFYSMLSIIIIIYSPIESLSVKSDVRVRRSAPQFVATKCILIDSVAKERCTQSINEDDNRHVTKTESCVIDESFRVKYKVKDGKMITSTIQTYGQNLPRLMQVGESETCYYNPQDVKIVRWTLTDPHAWFKIFAVVAGVVAILLFVGVIILAKRH